MGTDRLLAFYGDDFTGSTDAMDALSKAGVETVLFLEQFDAKRVDQEFPDAEAVGLAGTSRSMSPAEMEDELPDAFETLADVDAVVVHYKICSTFDSSPETGSIGKAIDIGADYFGTETVPLLPGAPPLGRYVSFGNMFASDGESVYRLDCHPTMSDHPVTPMEESDLQRHLRDQTAKTSVLVDVRDLNRSWTELRSTYREQLANDGDVLFIDSLYQDHLRKAGDLIWNHAREASTSPLFTVGSSGLEYALADYWADQKIIGEDRQYEPLDSVPTTFVMSGSASPITGAQIDAALDRGFSGIRIRTDELVSDVGLSEQQRVTERIVEEIESGNSVLAYTARGPSDPIIEKTKQVASDRDSTPDNVEQFIGEKQGEITRDALQRVDLDRVCIAGGDTCGAVAPHLDLYALQVRYPLAPGSPLCEASADSKPFDGVEIALKGGQLGHTDYFIDLERGTTDR